MSVQAKPVRLLGLLEPERGDLVVNGHGRVEGAGDYQGTRRGLGELREMAA